MWISDGHNCVFFTNFFKPKVVLYGGFSEISQNQFKLGDRVWISDGQNCVFFTSFAKPKVVLYEGFSEFGGLDF